MPWSWEKPLILKKYKQAWLKWFKVNRWWIVITSLAALPFLSAFIVIAIDSNWLGNNNWFDLERKLWNKTIWDWIGLLVAPIVLALAGFFIRQLLEKQEVERRELSEKQEDERRKHEALKDYLDDITALFLSDNWERAVQEKHKYQESKSTDDKVSNQKVFAIAKARTLAALNELNGKRQMQLIQFLSESCELVNFIFPGRSLDLKGAFLLDANLEGADLQYAHLEGADLRGAHLEGAHLSDANFKGAYLSGANLEGADLRGAHLEGAYLSGAGLEGADLIKAHLESAQLSGAHLKGADLREAHLEGAFLLEANLEGADLQYAHLEGAYLSGAGLEGADLQYAHLEGAQLSGAHLEGTDLKNISWNDETNWKGVTGLDTAKNIPENLKPHLIELGVLSPPESDNSEPPQPSPEEE